MPTQKSVKTVLGMINQARSTIHKISDEEGAAAALELGMLMLTSLTGINAGSLILSQDDPNRSIEYMRSKNLEIVKRLQEIVERIDHAAYTKAAKIVAGQKADGRPH